MNKKKSRILINFEIFKFVIYVRDNCVLAVCVCVYTLFVLFIVVNQCSQTNKFLVNKIRKFKVLPYSFSLLINDALGYVSPSFPSNLCEVVKSFACLIATPATKGK